MLGEILTIGDRGWTSCRLHKDGVFDSFTHLGHRLRLVLEKEKHLSFMFCTENCTVILVSNTESITSIMWKSESWSFTVGPLNTQFLQRGLGDQGTRGPTDLDHDSLFHIIE